MDKDTKTPANTGETGSNEPNQPSSKDTKSEPDTNSQTSATTSKEPEKQPQKEPDEQRATTSTEEPMLERLVEERPVEEPLPPGALKPILEPLYERHRSQRAVRISMQGDTMYSTCGLSDEAVETFDADALEVVLFHLDAFGTYQKLLLIMIMPFSVFYSVVYLAPFFVTLTPQIYWCMVPELASLSKEMRRELSAPGVANGDWDGCSVYVTDWEKVLATGQPPPPETPVKKCESGWEFELKDVPYETIVTERGWVCDRASYVPTSQSMFFAGSLAGGVIFGWMADSFGRIPALVGVNIVGGISGVASVYTNGAWDFIFCRFLYGIAYDNCLMIIYILILEYVGPTYRTLVANLPMVLYYGSANVAVPWVAYFMANWRLFTWVTASPMVIAVITPWLIPESVRWLASKGKLDKAMKVLKTFEKINKSHIPADVMEEFIEASNKALQEEQQTFFSIFRSPLLRSTALCMTMTYCGCDLMLDALIRLSESYGVDIFLTFTINALAEIPSVIVITILLDRLGRRNLTFAPIALSAICILIIMFIPEGIPQVVLTVIARFFISLSSNVTTQWGTEILPTPFRASGSAALHMTGFASSLFSPFIVYSRYIFPSLPLLILLVTAVISGVFCLVLPETKDQEMPQTVADCEKIISEYSLFGKPEVQELKVAMGKVFSTTFSGPVRHVPNTRVSRLNLEARSKSRPSISIQTTTATT